MGIWYDRRQALAKRLNFTLEHSQERYFRALQQTVDGGSRWLDLGCGRQLVPEWAALPDQQQAIATRARLVGLDVDGALNNNSIVHHKVMGIGEHVPFRDGTFDLVTANMVIEHLEQPDDTLTEIWRVLRVGGKFLFHTPNLRSPVVRVASWVPDRPKASAASLLDDRHESDIFKTHYRMNTREAILRSARRTNYHVESVEIGGSVGTLLRLGPLGLAEVFFLKLLSLRSFSRWNVTIIAVLVKAESGTAL